MVETNNVDFTMLMCENSKCQKLYSGIFILNEDNFCPECRKRVKFELRESGQNKVDNIKRFSNIK